jgi:hypothetical protein
MASSSPVADGKARRGGKVASGTVHGTGTVRSQPAVTGFRRFLPALSATLLVACVVAVAFLRTGALLDVLLVLVGAIAVQWGIALLVEWATGRSGSAAGPRLTGDRHARTPLRALSGQRDALPSVEVHSFDVIDVDGTRTRCDLVGWPHPAAPAVGAVVDVYGRRRKDSTVLVRQFVADPSQDRTRARLDGWAVVVRFGYVASTVLSVVAVLAVCWFSL